MALAFPGQGGMLWEVMARDAFLDTQRPVDEGTRSRKGPNDFGRGGEPRLLHGSHQPVTAGGRQRRSGPAERQVRAFVGGG